MIDALVDIDRRMRTVVERGWEEAPSPSLSRPAYKDLDDPRAGAKRKPDKNNCDIPSKCHRRALRERDPNVPEVSTSIIREG